VTPHPALGSGLVHIEGPQSTAHSMCDIAVEKEISLRNVAPRWIALLRARLPWTKLGQCLLPLVDRVTPLCVPATFRTAARLHRSAGIHRRIIAASPGAICWAAPS
jgi:hypothetical protein